MSIQREIRYIEATEVRAMGGSGDADPLRIEGYASVFNRSAKLPGFRERILPGAFTRAIDEKQDVVCLFNHNADHVLGRTTSGTLRLKQDARGLAYTCDLPNTSMARDLHESIRRGDINGCSFAFNIPDGGQEWSEQKDDEGYYVQRDISDTNLLDVSPVTYPCYSGTDVYARAAAEVPAELRSAVDAKNAALVTPPADIVPAVKERVMKTAVEMRQIVDAIDNNIDSFEDAICEVSQALAKAYPAPELADGMCAPCPYGGRFYEVETYEDFVIVVECATGENFMIPYLHDESKPEGEEITFGEPVEVEKTWVPSDRDAKKISEYRSAFPLPISKPVEPPAVVPAAEPVVETRMDGEEDDYELDLIDWRGEDYNDTLEHENHVDGDCMERDCICQNRMCMGSERADEKTRTKRVGDKDLTAKSFAYVGDKDKTETWKLPIHDASHVRNALSRFDQTDLPADAKAGAKRKILAAAKKFGIEASEAKSITHAERVEFADRLHNAMRS